MRPVRLFTATAALSLAACAATRVTMSPHSDHDIFPYAYTIHDLPSGLRLVTVPTDHEGIVSLYIVVAAGSRDEVEEGRSGFAHFFEHMMFRGSERFSSDEQTAIFKAAGADRNAYTTDDYTCYHETFATADLDRILEVEADRFQRLRYSESDFRTEAKAILGEYNTHSSNPFVKMHEAVRETAFRAHTYRHTTMGFLRDIERMPEMYDYSLQFFRRHYRPDTTTVLVVGDVEPAGVRAMVEKHFGEWRAEPAEAAEPAPEPPQTEPLERHVAWPAPTQPWIMVSFKGPAFSTTAKDMAALDLISSLAFSDNSDLYQKLFVREGKVDVLFPDFPDHVDPYLVSVCARVKRPEDVDGVRRDILATCERLRTETWPEDEIERAKAHVRYAFAAALDSPDSIAGALAGYLARARTPEALNAVYRMYEQLTAEDLRAAANRYLVDTGRTVTALSHGPLPVPRAHEQPADTATAPAVDTLLLPAKSPLVTFRLLFHHGAADDPIGKEGLAYVTAELLAGGGTKRRSYESIVAALYPMAASIEAQVDKEMTVFAGTVHRDNVEAFYAILREMLLEPGFVASDFERVRSNAISFLDDGLRRSDDEELGKEVLYGEIYEGHRYGHHDAGTLSGLRASTLDDVKAFWHEHYTPAAVTLGLAGGFDDALGERVARDLATGLPIPETAVATETAAAAAAPQKPDTALPAAPARSRMTIVEKQTTGTGVHIGFPIGVTRSHPDWVALWLVRSYFGEHRSDNSYLYQRLRETRGLNYGDYAYIEYFPRGSRLFQPPPNLARESQIFQMWLRPVEPRNGPFALKAALYELQKLVANGMSEEAFTATRDYLRNYVSLLVQTQDRRLGYALDSRYYGIPAFPDYVREKLASLTLADVNRVIEEHLHADRLQIVVVTQDAAAFREGALAAECAPPVYATPPAADVLAEDRLICATRVGVAPEDVEVVPVDEVFR
jgi:zinc protease